MTEDEKLVDLLSEAAMAGNAWPQHTLKADEAAYEARQILEAIATPEPVAPVSDMVERPVDALAQVFYEWGIGRGNDFGWDEAPNSIRDRCYHAADAGLRAIKASIRTPEAALVEALEKCRAKFAEYVELHKKKLLPERTPDEFFQHARTSHNAEVREKADRNQAMVDLCDAALAQFRASEHGER